MAVNDVHKLALVSQYEGVNCINLFYFQTSVIGAGQSELQNLITAFQATWLPAIANFCLNEVNFQAITARTLKPAITATLTQFINVNGDLSGKGLPSTCVQQITVWPIPSTTRSANWWRFTGIPHTAHRQGKLDNAHVTLLNNFGTAATSGDISNGGYTFRPVTKPKANDQAGVPRAPLRAYWTKPTVLNQRSRQYSVITG